MNINWLLLVVLMIFVISFSIGIIKGFFQISLSLVSAVLSIVLMLVLNPYISDFVAEHVPLQSVMEKKFMERFMPELTPDELAGLDWSGTPLAEMAPGDIKELSTLDLEHMGVTIHDIILLMGEIPEEIQIEKIKESDFPGAVKERLLENNTQEVYSILGVTSFPEYVAAYLSRMIIKIITFLFTFLLVVVIIKALSAVVEVIGDLPVIGFFNRAGGGILGIVIAVIVVWLVFMLITVFNGSSIAGALFDQIEQDPFLTLLYDNNILLEKLLTF